MKNGMSTNQKRAIFICAGILILLLTFFFVFQRNMETVLELETETNKYKSAVDYLSAMQMQVNEMQETAPEKQGEIDTYTQEFPCRMTQQKVIYNIYQMMTDTGVRITRISPGMERKFFEAGQFISLEGGENTSDAQTETVTGSAVEENPETKVSLDAMVGKVTTYELEMTGTRNQILKSVAWIANNLEHMAVTNLSFSFDSSTGKLTGTMRVNYFAMNGNGAKYEEPNISGIQIGTDNIFGTVK
ncbi:MAG: hypothetical protein J1F02_07195 [Lachnospiraceae bacterium]|nr:hypothetical protein [Lachnospiraceae bacterium]